MLTAAPARQGSNAYAATRIDAPARSRLAVDTDADVCIVGAGLAGLSLADELARLGWSVVVLEQRSVASGGTGRSAGVVRPGYALSAAELVERVGDAHAQALWAVSDDGAERIRGAAREMPGAALAEHGLLQVSRVNGSTALAREADWLSRLDASVEPWSASQVRSVVRSERFFEAVHHPRAFALNPLNYALGLAARAEAAGARLFEDTAVLDIDPAGVRKRITTPAARVRANHVVLAGGAQLGGAVARLAETLLPTHHIGLMARPAIDIGEVIGFPGAIQDRSTLDRGSHRVVDGRIMAFGLLTAPTRSPESAAQTLLRQLRGTYPGLGGSQIEHAWPITAARTVHRMPQVGEVATGYWVLNGFGANGLAASVGAASLVARGIAHGDQAWRMFEAFPLVWGGGTLGRAAVRLTATARSIVDSVQERWAGAGR